jgi:hypothetical protein
MTRPHLLRGASILAVLTICIAVRMMGLSWGLEKGYHPDEVASMLGVGSIDYLNGRVDARAGYFEGTLAYYLWAVPVAVIKLLEDPPRQAWRADDSKHWRSVLFHGRIATAATDVATALLVALVAWEITGAFYPSLLGALIYGIIPMEVIYAHFMRPHVLANFWCALVLLLSVKLVKKPVWWMAVSTGVAAGLGTVSRYPVVAVLAVPCLLFLFSGADTNETLGNKLRTGLQALVGVSLLWIGSGFTAGLFLGEPALFLSLGRVLEEIRSRMLPFVPPGQFSGAGLLNLSAVEGYLWKLVPYAMWPILWILPYAAIACLLWRRKRLAQTVPILIFSSIYLYAMAKGYYLGVFARATMMLFPGFCVLCSLVLDDFFQAARFRPPFRVAVMAGVLLVMLPSLAFDCAYVRAMQKSDPRSELYVDLERRIGNSPCVIGVSRSGAYFYTVMPGLRGLKNRKTEVRVQGADRPADYLLVGFRTPVPDPVLRKEIESVEKAEEFSFVRSYAATPRFLGIPIDLSSFPTDMTYPFPTILLFQKRPASVAAYEAVSEVDISSVARKY